MNAAAGTEGRARLLLVEDDVSIRRFVGMALDEMPLDIVEAPTLAAAVDALRDGAFQVVLCDLMLPDGSGLDLLRALGDVDSPCPGATRVAFSAGVSATMRQSLQQAGVHRVLSKPASLNALLDCVQQALDEAARLPVSTAPVAPAPDAGAVDEFFGGDHALFETFLAQCRPQFLQDAAAGDGALAGADFGALRRVAHSLKSVLLTLGHRGDSTLAARIEDAAAAGRNDTAAALWPTLAARLRQLAREGGA